MQLHADDGRARDPAGSPFACRSGCARPRERRAVGARPKRYDVLAVIELAPVTRWLLLPCESSDAGERDRALRFGPRGAVSSAAARVSGTAPASWEQKRAAAAG